jgi:gliding motility-associated transport system ATP-binding protein
MIRIENLTKYYGPVKAVEEINFSVAKGEIVGFLGPNAAGKTTTLRILTGFFPPSSGKAMIGEYDVTQHPIEAKKLIGYMPENPPLYNDMTVRSFLTFAAKIRTIPRALRKEAIEKTSVTSGLTDRQKSIIGHLSKGYRQRVALAQALLHDPEILILDEPTAGLDAKERMDLLNLIHGFTGSKTVILSTHILADVERVCNRVIIIHKGRIVAEGSQDVLSSSITNNERIKLTVLRNDDFVETELPKIEGILKVARTTDNPLRFTIETIKDAALKEKISKLLVDNNCGLVELSPARLPLEEIFIELTKEEAK